MYLFLISTILSWLRIRCVWLLLIYLTYCSICDSHSTIFTIILVRIVCNLFHLFLGFFYFIFSLWIIVYEKGFHISFFYSFHYLLQFCSILFWLFGFPYSNFIVFQCLSYTFLFDFLSFSSTLLILSNINNYINGH